MSLFLCAVRPRRAGPLFPQRWARHTACLARDFVRLSTCPRPLVPHHVFLSLEAPPAPASAASPPPRLGLRFLGTQLRAEQPEGQGRQGGKTHDPDPLAAHSPRAGEQPWTWKPPGSGCWGRQFRGDLIALKGGQQGQEAEDASDGLNLERLIQLRRDNIPGVPIVCEGPEGRLSVEWLGLSHAKLSAQAEVGGGGEARPRVLGARPVGVGAGSGAAALGIKAQGGKEDASETGMGLWVRTQLCDPHDGQVSC